MSPFLFIVYALATFRLALMFSKEKGPCNVFSSFRDEICKKQKCLVEGANCLWCWSIWTGAFFFLVSLTGYGLEIAMIPALSAVAVILNLTIHTRLT